MTATYDLPNGYVGEVNRYRTDFGAEVLSGEIRPKDGKPFRRHQTLEFGTRLIKPVIAGPVTQEGLNQIVQILRSWAEEGSAGLVTHLR